MQIIDLITRVIVPLIFVVLICVIVALNYRANQYKAERDTARQQVITFNAQLNAILQDYHEVAMREAKIAQTAKEQKLQYLATITDLTNANLTGDCMQAVGYMVDSGKKLH